MFQLWPRLFNPFHYWILKSLLKHGHSVDVMMVLERQVRMHILQNEKNEFFDKTLFTSGFAKEMKIQCGNVKWAMFVQHGPRFHHDPGVIAQGWRR